MKTKTWLPLFQGFYGTILEPDESNVIEYIIETREQNGLPEIEYIGKYIRFEYDSYNNDIAKACTEYVENILINLEVVKSIAFEAVVSPKEYNFANDSINVEVELTQRNIIRISELIEQYYEEFEKFLRDNYTSRSGFTSFYSPDPKEWNVNECVNHDHKLGSLLDFMIICHCLENGDDYEGVYDFMCEEALCNSYLGCENFDELTECFMCTECGEFITNASEHRSILYNITVGNMPKDGVICSECELAKIVK